ncbi:MAG: immunoglobulin domain-containing protein [Limisphaerales bacterium]
MANPSVRSSARPSAPTWLRSSAPAGMDDPVQQKRIELFRLPLADNQSTVRLRFAQVGTGSWFFDIDNLGFYSIPNPIINQQPSPVNADYNSPATFSVQASGDNLTYQWQFNGTNIAGANNTTYSIANCTTNNIGLYSVAVTNSYGGLVSAKWRCHWSIRRSS